MRDVYMTKIVAGVWLRNLYLETIYVHDFMVMWSCIAGDHGFCRMFID